MSIPEQLIDIAGQVLELKQERDVLVVRVKNLLEQNDAMLTIVERWLKESGADSSGVMLRELEQWKKQARKIATEMP